MIVDNFDLLQSNFDKLVSKEDFFFIQVIQRKKDDNDVNIKIIRNFYIYNKEDFLEKKNYIIQLCKQHNAGVYFWINPKNARDISLECIKAYADLISQEDCSKGYKLWDKKCELNVSSNYEKLWIVDVDSKDPVNLKLICELINNCWRDVPNIQQIKQIIPTLNGYHIITNKFNAHYFKQLLIINNLEYVDIYRNNPTLLYYEET